MAAVLFKWLMLLHPFYISVADINHNAKEKTLEISIRIFTDDFEKTLRQNFNAKIDLTNPADKKAMNELVSRYISNHFKLKVNGKQGALNYIGYEKIEESIWCYFEVQNITTLQNLHISNSILYDWQPKQTNMHIIKYNGKEQSRKVDNPETELDFSF